MLHKIVTRLPVAGNLFSARFFRHRFPFAVSWHLTYRCNYNCAYCDISSSRIDNELTTQEVLTVIKELHSRGCHIISFCGGESLMRSDAGEIFAFCQRKNIQVYLISNGSVIDENKKLLKNVNLLKLSIDGPQHIHDQLRGNGAYEKVLHAAEIAKKYNVKVAFNTVLTRLNMPYLADILTIAAHFDIPVKFSPLHYVHAGNKPIHDLLVPIDEYKRGISFLMQELKYNRYIVNSLSSLKYLYGYPDGKPIKHCIAGRIFCHIKPDGEIYPCERMVNKKIGNCMHDGVKKTFEKLPVCSCSHCWCTGTLELNMIFSLKPDAILKAIKYQV